MPGDARVPEGISYVKAAFKWQYNVIGLLAAAGFSLLSQSPLPLILASGLELMYLAVVPNMPRFQRLVRSWKYEEEKRRQRERLNIMVGELSPELRQRYQDLHRMCREIRRNYANLSTTGQIFAQQMDDKLDGLLQSYLRLSHAMYVHRDHIQLSNPDAIRREMQQLQKTLPSQPEKVREINQRRVEILQKRLEKFDKMRENRAVIEAQCGAVEDVLNLIRDQSVTMTDPQAVSARLEGLIEDVEHTEKTVQEVESVFAMGADLDDTLPPMPSPGATSTQSAQRHRTRS